MSGFDILSLKKERDLVVVFLAAFSSFLLCCAGGEIVAAREMLQLARQLWMTLGRVFWTVEFGEIATIRLRDGKNDSESISNFVKSRIRSIIPERRSSERLVFKSPTSLTISNYRFAHSIPQLPTQTPINSNYFGTMKRRSSSVSFRNDHHFCLHDS